MHDVLAQLIIGAELLVCLWAVPGILLGPRRRALRRARRRASYGVKDALTWPHRRQARRYAGQLALRFAVRETGSRDQAALSGAPAPDSGPSTWAPARVAAMPTDRCNACPLWGCAVKGASPECATHPFRRGCHCPRCLRVTDSVEVTVADRFEPVAHVPTAYTARPDRCPSCARNAAAGHSYCIDCDRAFDPAPCTEEVTLVESAARRPQPPGPVLAADLADAITRLDPAQLVDYLAAMMGARRPQPGDDKIANPPPDDFDLAAERATGVSYRRDGSTRRKRPPEERLAAQIGQADRDGAPTAEEIARVARAARDKGCRYCDAPFLPDPLYPPRRR